MTSKGFLLGALGFTPPKGRSPAQPIPKPKRMLDSMPRKDINLPPSPREAELIAELNRLRETPVDQTSIRPCPFCHQPATEYCPRGERSWTVECRNKHCVVMPGTYDYGAHDCTSPDPKQTARDVWNGKPNKHS